MPCSPVVTNYFGGEGGTHGILDFVDDGFASSFDAEVLAHGGNMVCRCSSADDAFGVHNFAETVAFDEQVVMSRCLFDFTDHSSRNSRDALGLVVRSKWDVP